MAAPPVQGSPRRRRRQGPRRRACHGRNISVIEPMDQFELRVTDIVAETALIRAIKLARPHGEPLPSWEAGAHVKVRLPDGNERSYSLINTSLDPAATTRPHAYRLVARLEQPSQGGSKFMHALRVGDVLSVSAPSNNF